MKTQTKKLNFRVSQAIEDGLRMSLEKDGESVDTQAVINLTKSEAEMLLDLSKALGLSTYITLCSCIKYAIFWVRRKGETQDQILKYLNQFSSEEKTIQKKLELTYALIWQIENIGMNIDDHLNNLVAIGIRLLHKNIHQFELH